MNTDKSNLVWEAIYQSALTQIAAHQQTESWTLPKSA